MTNKLSTNKLICILQTNNQEENENENNADEESQIPAEKSEEDSAEKKEPEGSFDLSVWP